MLKSRGKRSSRPSRPHPLFSKRFTAAPCRSVHPEASLASLDPQSSQVAQKRAETASTRYRQAARASSTLPADMSFTSLPAIPPYAARGEPCKAHRTTGERAARSSRSTFSSFQGRRHSDSLRCKIEARRALRPDLSGGSYPPAHLYAETFSMSKLPARRSSNRKSKPESAGLLTCSRFRGVFPFHAV